MAINVTGVFLGMKHAAPAIAGRGRGSDHRPLIRRGTVRRAGHTLYGASKGAVRIMTKDAAIELAPAKVRVNSVHPGYVNTGMARYGADTLGTTVEQLGGMCPLGRIGEPGDVANAILFLASDESSYVTGSGLVIDGGGSASLGLPT